MSSKTDIDATMKSEPESGPKIIAAILKTLPNAPGVYRMLDKNAQLLYVGKARSLKKRVASYTRLRGHTNRIQRMIVATTSMEFITTATESDALLLEANLIKRLKPRYNVLLRDDKAFPYILIARDHEVPQLVKHRGARRRKGDYYGPFASAGSVNRALNTLQRVFLLRSCSDSVYENRTRPCLLYQIKRCSAPCTGEISVEDYGKLLAETSRFLSGKSKEIQAHLASLMEAASNAQDYERAATYRDRLAALTQIQSHQEINPTKVREADVFAAYEDAGQTCIQVFFFRTGQNWGNRAYFPRADKEISLDQVVESFIAQFYDNKPCPRLVLLSLDLPRRDLLAQALSTRAGRKVTLAVPKHGEKRGLVDHALTNAREALARRLAQTASTRNLLAGVAKAFEMAEPPRRIEVYDNSHIQGSQAVGGMIVAGVDGFAKAHYRKFNIKSEELTPGDDFAMMREVLSRRFKRLMKLRKEAGQNEAGAPMDEDGCENFMPEWPDLLLIDGGAGQLSATHEALDEIGVTKDMVTIVAIAKGPERNAGRERFFMRGRRDFMLPSRDPVLYFIQRLRDEAHRFAIGTHRARRKKALTANPLDDVPTIGPARKRALLRHFGSAKAVSRAGLSDLQAVDGISARIARLIYDHFNEGAG